MILTTFLEKVNLFVNTFDINYYLIYVILSLITAFTFIILTYKFDEISIKLFYNFLSIGILVTLIYVSYRDNLSLFIKVLVSFLFILVVINLLFYSKKIYKEKNIIYNNSNNILEDYYRDYRNNYLIEYVPIKKKKSFF